MNGEPLLDQEVLEMLRDAIGDSLEEIITLYLTDVPQMIRDMRNALNNSDLDTLRRLAHSLKSSSANLGAMQASALAADLEHDINVGKTDNAELLVSINKFSLCFDQTRSLLDAKKNK